MNYDYKTYAGIHFYKEKCKSNIVNLGNSCYLNVSLSCISNCLGLTHYFLSNEFKKSIGPASMERKEFIFLKNYIGVLSGLFEKNQTISPKTLHHNISIFLPNLKKGHQNDAYECIIGILDLLHISLGKKIDYGPVDTKIHHRILASKKVYYEHFKDEFSIINDLFFGQFTQKVKCMDCGKCSFTYQPFIGLNLAIPQNTGSKIITIYDLLLEYFKKQIVKKNCEVCVKDTNHSLKTRIIKLPVYLIIHLKRFDNNTRKLETYVPFESELEMSNYSVLLDSKSTQYNLSSVVNHQGNSTETGHYYNYNRTFDGEWVMTDDDKTEKIQSIDVCSKNAYILFYELNEF